MDRCVAALDTHVSVIRGLDVTRDGKYLISGARDKIVSMTDLSNYKTVRSFPIFEVSSLIKNEIYKYDIIIIIIILLLFFYSNTKSLLIIH